jgi:HD-GYP domain-containing protein (c-di-GMP phosphodiesterase class II)
MSADKLRINIFDTVLFVARIANVMVPALGNHLLQVAYLAYRLAEELKLPDDRRFELFMAGALHDIGALSLDGRLDLLGFEDNKSDEHSIAGSLILKTFQPFSKISELIKFHHVPWKNGKGAFQNGESVSRYSHLIHLVDRVAVKISGQTLAPGQVQHICHEISVQKGELFVPEHVDAFLNMAGREDIWPDVVSKSIETVLKRTVPYEEKEVSNEKMLGLSRLIARLISFKSRFTAEHSSGVASVAVEMSRFSGFSKHDQRLIEIAAYLHDLGKLAIPSPILEKQDKLSDVERSIMQSHVYHTYQVLEPFEMFRIAGFWGTLHQERLNGTGYPFGLTSDELPMGARIMAVADVFTALTENRPYRKGMNTEDAKGALKSMVNAGELDGHLVELVFQHYDEINTIRASAQKKTVADHHIFQEILHCHFDAANNAWMKCPLEPLNP